MKDLRLILTVLLLSGAALLVVVFALNRIRVTRSAKPQPAPSAERSGDSPDAKDAPYAAEMALPFIGGGESVFSSILRGGLVALAFVVAAGMTLVLLPEGAFDRVVQTFQSRQPVTQPQERIAFLYLGDEIKDGDFHLRGVVRNITIAPIEKLDATVRLYSRTGQLLETRSVRMDSELIPPDATAQFHLVYPGYAGQFSSYSVEFVSRQGETVPYKDMRGARGRG